MYHQLNINGAFNFKATTLDCDIDLTYGRDDYMDIRSMDVWSDRRKAYVPASERLIRKFQNDKWNWLYDQCNDHRVAMAEYYKEARCA